MRVPILIGAIVIMASSQLAYSQPATQAPDEQPEIYTHSPHKATIYAAILPGLGQAYNKKYWKIPIVYAGFATITYFALDNQKEYRIAKEAFNYVSAGEEYPIDNKYVGRYPASDLMIIRDYFRRNTEVSWILMGVWYLLNIIDATVDAHLFYYDLSEDLSVELMPAAESKIQPKLGDQPFSHARQLITLRYTF
ncbi:MAG: DUF5683 domain-containing protein [Bacteroidales bacterium]|nr:DUF5683 domain-containing protein [Bacteroidales bacterium]